MGGAVSSGRDNNELVDNLMSGNYIRTRIVERVFRALDRADYMSAEARDQAYKDLAWRNGPLHLSAPCIYSEVMEALELKPGLSFLNIGSGTGYLSTLVGLIIGSAGISHGVEVSPIVYEYANTKLSQFIENSVVVDDFDFSIPKYYTGNALCLTPTHSYDRVYCGAGVVPKYENYFKQFIKVGGVLVMPLADQLVQLRRVTETYWTRRNLLNVSFAHLGEPSPRDRDQLLALEEQCPVPLQVLARAAIRAALHAGVQRRSPELREPPPPPPPQPRQGPRRICIPFDGTSDEEVSDAEWEELIHFADEMNELHDLDEAGGAHEMNALLSLVLSMGQNRAAGSLRFEHEDVRPELAHEDLEREEEAAAAADDDFIVFDVGVRAAMRRARPRPPPAAPDAGDDPAPPAPDDAEYRAPASPPPPVTTGPITQAEAEAVSNAEAEASSSSGESAARGTGAARARASPRAPRAPPRAPLRAPPRPRASTRSVWSDSSSEDDAAQVKDNKRQKLDSGIGEGTASSSASPDKSDDKTSHTHSSNSEDDEDDDTDMPWVKYDGESGSSGADSESGSEWEAGVAVADVVLGGALGKRVLDAHQRCRRVAHAASRRRRGRGRGARAHCPRPPCESDSGAEGEAGAGEGAGPSARRMSSDARRVRLSLAMKRAVKELPLPHALKKYINFGRCYQI